MLTLICHALGFILCVVLVVARLSTCGCGSLNHVPSDRNLTADVGEVCVCVCVGGGGERNTILSAVQSRENYSPFIITQLYIYIYSTEYLIVQTSSLGNIEQSVKTAHNRSTMQETLTNKKDISDYFAVAVCEKGV